MPIYEIPPLHTPTVEVKKPEPYKPQHKHWYCGKKFRVNGKEYLYLEGIWDLYEGEIVTVIKFTDGKQRFTVTDEYFFSKPKVFYNEKGERF